MKLQTANQTERACAPNYSPTETELHELAKYEADLSFLVFAFQNLALTADRRDVFLHGLMMIRAGMRTIERTTNPPRTVFVPIENQDAALILRLSE